MNYDAIPHRKLVELMSYDPATGIFMWKVPRKGIKVGVPLGRLAGHRYMRIMVFGQLCYAHRLAWFYVHGKWPAAQIDHINGDPTDNRIENLREATPAENQQNHRRAQANSESKALGVSWHKRAGKWQAHICQEGRRIYLGLYASIDEAKRVYLDAKRSLHPFCTI